MKRPDVGVFIRTSVAPALFALSLRAPAQVAPIAADSGVAQLDSLRLDVGRTAQEARSFYDNFSRLVQCEAEILRDLGASIVVGDVPPLAFAAAAAAGLPSIALANFTWDWIYEGYEGFEADAPGVLQTIRNAYSCAALALRLPLHGGFQPMRHVTTDIPFIARRSRFSREEIRRRLSLRDDVPVVLASFGGYGADLPYRQIADDNRFLLIVTDHEAGDGLEESGRLRRLKRHEFAGKGLQYEDLVCAADVVVTKPGYGIVSECVANRTALVYTSRGPFVEYGEIVRSLPALLPSEFLTPEDLLAGRWGDAIERVREKPFPEPPPVNGAEVAAEEILRALDNP